MMDAEVVAVPPVGVGPTPMGIRIASILCWLVGLITFGVAVALYLPAANHTPEILAATLVTVIVAIFVCVAAVLVQQRRKLGAYLVVGAWGLPLVWALSIGAPAR